MTAFFAKDPHLALNPFPGEKIDRLSVEAKLVRSLAGLRLSFRLSGEAGALARLADLCQAPSHNSARRDGLWTATCFEMFWGLAGEESYWELNLSPAGDWNVYAFDAYRQGMRREERIDRLKVGARPLGGDGRYQIWAEADLSGLSIGKAPLVAGLSAILDHGAGRLSHWALLHPGERPDFHRREAFTLTLGN